VHHADKEMDASTGVRFHPIEIILSSMVRMAIIPLLGIQAGQLLMYELVLLPIILFHHSNIRLSETVDRILRLVIVTPHMHRLHHSDIKSETNSNYASVFSFWDKLFNSYTMRSIETGFQLGLGKQFSLIEWNTFKGFMKIPFQKLPPYIPPE
jgi:sterol desaturase/sphingolipid hydroxylase (fatty acid hydroxylase superfamily)